MGFDETCSQVEFAALVGASKQAISQRVKEGLLRDGQSAAQWVYAYCEQLRTVASGREVSTQRQQLEAAKTREALANASTKELELYRAYQLILELDQVEHAMKDWAQLARDEFINSIEKILEMIESAHNITIEREKVDAITHAATRAIGDYSVQPAGIN